MPDEKPKNTPDKTKIATQSTQSRYPLASIGWAIAAILLLLLGFRTVTMHDQEKFIADFAFAVEEGEEPNSLILNIASGTFEYGVVPEVPTPVQTGTYTDGEGSVIAAALFDASPDVAEVRVEPNQVTVIYESEQEPEAILRRLTRPMSNAVLNDGEAITGDFGEEENAIVFTLAIDEDADSETYQGFEYGQYTPTLIPDGTSEVYESSEEALNGTPLSRAIAESTNSIATLTIEPTRLLVTYIEGTAVNSFIDRITEALNDFHPRASLQIELQLLTVRPSSDVIIDIEPYATGIPLMWYAIAFALIEGGLFIYLGNSDDKLVRPLIRVVSVFFLYWSVFGHEPLWDFILHWIFPTSNQYIHPNGTVIDFTAQHLELVIVSSLITIPAGLFFGILVTRDDFREMLPLVNNLVNSGQTVPTIAVVAIMAPIIGLGFWPAIVALVAYGLLPVVRNTIAGIESVSDFIIDSARGMGMTPGQILFQIEMPIASNIIIAGIRTSIVINVGTATLGAFVGSGGLGTPISSGLAMSVHAFVLLGAIPAALLAILLDYIMGRIEFVLTPRGLQIET